MMLSSSNSVFADLALQSKTMPPVQRERERSFTLCNARSGSFTVGPLNLAKAMSNCALEDAEVLPMVISHDMDRSQSQCQTSQTQTQSQSQQGHKTIRIPKRLALELSSQPSQELICTPDFATPVEQQFPIDYDPGLGHIEDGCSRSPAPSPIRFQKRPRPIHLDGADSDTNSQASLSHSRSLSEPSSCSNAAAAPSMRLPPMHPKGRVAKAPTPPDVIPNPYIQSSGFDDQPIISRPNGLRGVEPLPKQPRMARLHWEYQVQQAPIGHGNFSTVFRAIHRQSGKWYAIKKSKKPLMTAADKTQWISEIQALAALEGHPHIVKFYDSWSETDNSGEHILIKLELCHDCLGTLVHQKVQMREQELLDILRQMASALKHMHDRGIVHLDVKPENIYRGSEGLYKLGDFGLATASDGSGRVLEGDARYLAPELLRNNYEALDKADIFALGATLYELASGNALPTGGERYHALRNGQLMMLPHISVKLQSLIKKLMSSDPKARPSAELLLKMALLQTNPLQLQSSTSSPRMMVD